MPESQYGQNQRASEEEITKKIVPCVRGLRPEWHERVVNALIAVKSSNQITSEGAATILKMLGIRA